MCEHSGLEAAAATAGGRFCACARECCSFAVRLLPPRRDQRTRGAMQNNSNAETEAASYRRRYYKRCQGPHWFPCAQPHGACLAKELICNGIDNCVNGEDERNCPGRSSSYLQRNCSSHTEYMCQDRSCIPLDFVCDGKADCADNSDETAGCKQSTSSCTNGHLCANGRCLQRKQWVCDGVDDCGDNSDERECDKFCQPSLGKFMCRNRSQCLSLDKVCDGQTQCSDGSDESETCHAKPDCSTKTCPTGSTCHMLPNSGPECYCPKGFRMAKYMQRCEDIDECQEQEEDESQQQCSQRCENTSGSYRCSCDAGYELNPSDNRTCQVQQEHVPLLLYTTQVAVMGMQLDRSLRPHVYGVASNLSKVIGVAYDGDHIYWTNIQNEAESIVRAKGDGSLAEILLTSGLDAPEDLAVDWLTHNIYFTDNVMQHIAVCSADALSCAPLVTEDVQQPRSLALWPQRGLMFWTDWGVKPMIGRAAMDGRQAHAIVNDNIHWPNGIALDMHQDRIYWVDGKLGSLQSVRSDGSARRSVLEGLLKHPYGLAIFEDQLYWSDWHTKSLHACHKHTGKNHRVLVRDRTIYAVHVYHPAKQPRLAHACESARCSHLCLLSEPSLGGYSCACPAGMLLAPDQRRCLQQQKRQRLFIGAGQQLLELEHTTFGRHLVSASHSLPCYIHELLYNPLNNSLFIADNLQHVIFVFDLLATGAEPALQPLVQHNLGNISGMALDSQAQNLYWTDAERNVIEVYSLRTHQRALVRFFSGGEQPIGLSVMPQAGFLFVALKARRYTHIDRLPLTGRGPQLHVFEQELGDDDIKFIADTDGHTLYWSDSDTGRISYTNYMKTQAQLFRAKLRRPYSLALLQQDLFWTEIGTPSIFWTHKHNIGLRKRFELEPNVAGASVSSGLFSGASGIFRHTLPARLVLAGSSSLPSAATTPAHACVVHNGGCSHICVSAGQDHSACLCPAGYVYSDASNRTCTESLDCEFRCRDSGECLTSAHRCNAHQDCLDNSDELDCATTKRLRFRCALQEFACHDGELCLERRKRCDGHKDCHDNSDELHCSQFDRSKLCHQMQHACDNGKCVDSSVWCDGQDDCGDNSDEQRCLATETHCTVGQFQCSSGSCIASSWECDGKIDCSDASDEHDKCGRKQCAPNMHRCLLGQCLDAKLVCDGHNDCGDQSDELNCSEQPKLDISCGDQYQCSSNLRICLPVTARCNGSAECPRGEDEADCGEMCSIYEFKCRSIGQCIRQEFRCDGERDCDDGSDEQHCEQRNATTAAQSWASQGRACTSQQFDCHDGECVDLSRVCNGFADCSNGHDEGAQCESACRPPQLCQHKCQATPAGAICSCNPGYRLDSDQRSCVDIDECAAQPTEQACAQLCENTPGSYHCQCYPDFMLRQDRTSCKSIEARAALLFSSYDELRNMTEEPVSLQLAWQANDTAISGFDVDLHRQRGYFSSSEQQVLYQMDLEQRTPRAALRLSNPSKLAVEWTTGNVYVISGSAATELRVCNFAAKMCARLLQLTQPHLTLQALAVDALNARMFYAAKRSESYQQPSSQIYMARLDGSRRELMLRKQRSYVTALAVDTHQQLLYFTDLHSRTLEVLSYKSRSGGLQRQAYVMLQKSNAVMHPTGLSVYENHAYIVNMGSKEAVRCQLYAQRLCTSINLNVLNAQHIVVAGISRQPLAAANPCQHAHCAGMCVLAAYGYECLCGDVITPESQACPAGSTSELNMPSFGADSSSSSSSSFWLFGLFVIFGLVAAGFGYMYYQWRQRGHHRDLNINLHFQNPLATLLNTKLQVGTTELPLQDTRAGNLPTVVGDGATGAGAGGSLPSILEHLETPSDHGSPAGDYNDDVHARLVP
ncbi:yl [Drosophila busckii]|uniref:Yl n=1 Tax=Drosophila busckii TaxID=30019 RepID=A0A0M4ETD4_DROBS|nr:putative vitellogenin receptor [Drosophila busckii]ALC49752.1 yl [Drosophila busckii]